MKPEVKIFVKALRDGKGSTQAFSEYCWARSVVLIDFGASVDAGRDPMNAPPTWQCMAEAMGSDAFNAGADDEQIAEAFAEGMKVDRERRFRFRVARKDERPSQGDLLRAMSLDEQLEATKFFGVKNVALAILADSPPERKR